MRSHAILPGVAVGYPFNGMSAGDDRRGLLPALRWRWWRVGQPTHAFKEDASFAGFYLGSLALGVTLVCCAALTSTCCICCSARFWR